MFGNKIKEHSSELNSKKRLKSILVSASIVIASLWVMAIVIIASATDPPPTTPISPYPPTPDLSLPPTLDLPSLTVEAED